MNVLGQLIQFESKLKDDKYIFNLHIYIIYDYMRLFLFLRNTFINI